MNPSPPLDVERLRDALIGPWRRLDVVEETGSTNADLLARSSAGEDIDAAVLLAEHQSAGRGRHGRAWSTPRRSQLALSVGVGAATVPTTGWGWLTLAAGVAVIDALAEVAPSVPARLKWPNDVLVGDGKLAGILAEVAGGREVAGKVIVVGLGLNVAMTPDEIPEGTTATSLTMLGTPADRTALATAVLRALAGRLREWRAARGADDALRADYRRHSATLGARVRASMPGDRQIEGIAADIDELGRLCIDTGGRTVTVSAGDVTHLRPGG